MTLRDPPAQSIVSPQSDEELAHAAGQGRSLPEGQRAAEEAFLVLHDRHAQVLFLFLRARLGEHDAAEILQETWLRAWNALPRQFHGGNFRAWLFQIARNAMRDLRRRRRPGELPDGYDGSDDSQPAPDETVLDRERNARLLRCLEGLSEEQRDVATARMAGQTPAHIAQDRGVPPQRVYKLMNEAKERLQTCMGRDD